MCLRRSTPLTQQREFSYRNSYFRRHEYFHLLRVRIQQFHRVSYAQTRRAPRVREVVLLNDKAPRGIWKLARIALIRTETGNMIRTARIQTSTGRLFDRTIAQLYPLDVSDDEAEARKHPHSSDSSGTAGERVLAHDAVCNTSHAVVASAVIVPSIRLMGRDAISFFLLLIVVILMK
ncbi:unnamed protein product [Toxocara canis]|uniref:DUF5641 domain-containing protein n=1 Tax=Toxocara canis TaxID=6265 RepID=A0A183UY17_TOXCA|nr:unnamed protein product [Toxocara canis]